MGPEQGDPNPCIGTAVSIAPSACSPSPSGCWAQPLPFPSLDPLPLSGQGTSHSCTSPSAFPCSSGLRTSISSCTEQTLLQEDKAGSGEGKNNQPYLCERGCHVHDSRSQAPWHAPCRGLVPCCVSQPLLLCTSTHPVPKCYPVMINPCLGVHPPGSQPSLLLPPAWPLCPLLSPPIPGQEVGLHICRAFIWHFCAGDEGPASPDRERSASLHRVHHGRLECTEELLRARWDQAWPALCRGLSGRAFMETWSSAPGAAAPASSCCPAMRGGGAAGKLGARRRCHCWGGMWVIGNVPITEVSATGSARDNSDGRDSIWLLLLGCMMGWDGEPAPKQPWGCQQRGEAPLKPAAPASTGPAPAAASCRR